MSNYQLVKNTEWKEVEINGEDTEIPTHWNVKNVSEVSKCWDNKRKPLNQTERSNKKGNIPYWGANNIVDYVNEYLIDEEVVLLGEDAAPFYDKTKRVAFVSNEKIWPNNHIHVLKPLINSYFLMTTLNAVQYEKIIGTESRPKLTQGMMNAIEFSYPSEKEQSSIASILSEQESIIQDIESLISKYEARFQYLSDELLSGRLRVKEVDGEVFLYKNPEDNWKEVEINGEVKDIPSDWEIEKIEKLFNCSMGQTILNKDVISSYKQNYIPVFSATEEDKYFGYIESKKVRNILSNNDIVIPARGNSIGFSKLIKEDSTSTQTTIQLKSLNKIDSKIVYYLFKKNKESFFPVNPGTIPQLTVAEVNQIEIVKLDIKEQNNIISILDTQEDLINKQKELLEKEKQKFNWLLNNLLSGKYLVKE